MFKNYLLYLPRERIRAVAGVILPPIVVTGNSSTWASQIEQHVYNNSPYYAYLHTQSTPSSEPRPSTTSTFNIDDAIIRLNASAASKSQHRCAKYVRLAIQAGGINTNVHPAEAREYKPYLLRWGFKTVDKTDYAPLKGDIRVFQPYPNGNPAGHIDMYNGSHWVSDFRENNVWPGRGYANNPDYGIFRWPQ